METVIRKPKEFSADFIRQIVELLDQGNQISMKGIEKRLMKADLIALIVDNDMVLATACLKNPDPTYKEKVFESAMEDDVAPQFDKELGYIVTRNGFEGQKLCQKLLSVLIPKISDINLFATTRNESIIHILAKFGFSKSGQPYNDGVNLLLK